VPVDVFENGIHPRLETGLRARLNIHGAYEDVLQGLGAEMRWAGPTYIGPPLEPVSYDAEVVFPCTRFERSIWGTVEGLATFSEEFDRPLAYAETVAEVDAYRWPDPDWFDYEALQWLGYEAPVPVAQWAQQNGNYARIVGGWNPIFSRIMELVGFERGLMQIAAQPDMVEAMVAKIEGYLVEFYTRLARATRGHADIMGFGDDFASQEAMILSPRHWRRYFLPVWRRLFEIAHDHGFLVQMHMCGAVRPILSDLIDAGLNIYQVMQVTAKGMDPQELKREFGADVTFYGGINTQGTLPYGSPDDVRREVRELIEIMARDGCFILSSMHFLMDDVPPENAMAMYDEARAYRPAWAR
jgi:uroporphyrinogen decarboxylase